MFHKITTYLVIFILSQCSMIGQNAIVGPHFSSGWGGGGCPTGNANFSYLSNNLGGSLGGIFTASGTGYQYLRFGIDWSGTTSQRTITIGSDVEIFQNTIYTLNSSCTTSGALKINVTNTANKYVFKTRNGGTNPSGDFLFFVVQGDVRNIPAVSQAPLASSVTTGNAVTVTAITDGNLNAGQGIYLRYTTNNWSSSTILPMSGAGTSFTAAIPSQSAGTVVSYYIFSSGSGLSIANSDADLFTITSNNNSSINYSYTVLSGSIVTVSPSNPLDTDPVTITFDATSTPLSTANKVYLHSGVSTVQAAPTSFHYAKGNWGQDDGLGLMTQVPGQPSKWSITLASGMRAYYNVPSEKDIFGLNFLFRNAAGTTKEDNNGVNYFNTTNPGSYFSISSPQNLTNFYQVGQSASVNATANIAPTTWTLTEVDLITDNTITTLLTQSGSTNFAYTLPVTNTATRKFRITCNFGGLIKSKYFLVTGYNAVTIQSRPAGARPGINYDINDASKATLVLHAPTFTTSKDGNGNTTTTKSTTPKKVIYVIGDFNNWTPSESYKMKKDPGTSSDVGDYWWIELTGLVPSQEYVFQYLIDGELQVADPYTQKVSDPDDYQIPGSVYPNLISYRPQATDRASVIQTNQQPYPWTAAPFTKPSSNNLNIYELHFRDFTEEGTYLAAINRLDYIKGLGINAVHIMPVSEFEGNSSWGYNPNFYFAADKSYGTSNDLKKFIDECHKRQILVFNDLVLNHTFYSNTMARMYWNQALNRPSDENPYLNAQHKMIRNTAGHWGADWNHESEHTQKMVDSILGFWLSEYKLDGFRFDFTKGFGQTNPDDFPPGDDWGSAYNQARIDLLKRMINRMWTNYPGSVAIFEHLANSSEDKVLADFGILMWSGVAHHNDVKGMILGYNQDNTNIYNSGVYNAPNRSFTYANWMSYGESHDEERLGYEVKQYFNWSTFSGPKSTSSDSLNAIIDRLKISAAFNLFLPGPRMLWQFQELGYDYSIDFNGRTGEKPVRWDYATNSKRKELFNLISRILKIRNNYSIYSTSPDYGNIGLGAGNISAPRVMRFSSIDNKHVIVVANLDPGAAHDVVPNFDVTGDWYRYNGGSLNESLYNVNAGNQNGTYLLQPSETIVFTNFKIDQCSDVRNANNAGIYSLRDAIICAPENGSVNIEFPLQDQTITLSSPIVIDKNITITGFPSARITIDGSAYSGNLFSILAGKQVTINGITFSCAQGGGNGRCILNNGILTLDEIKFHDINGTSGGNTIYNAGTGTITIKNNVQIHK
jgi:1,4-alpha-glucan branching enzyme